MHNPYQIIQALYNRLTLRAHCGSINIGLIGVGGWGASNAANIMRSRRFNICGVYDKQVESAKGFANRIKTRCHPKLDDILNDPTIQAVAITVPNQFHAELVKAAADAGKHIFIEKPLASEPEVCRELGQYCLEKEVILQVGHQMHREPIFCEIKRILESGILGTPLYAQAVYALDRRNRDDWRQNAEACPGGSMEQLGVHIIDVLINLFGAPQATQGWSENIPRTSILPDWGCVSLSFAHNIHASISTSFSSPSHMRLEIFCESGHLATDGKTLWSSRSGASLRKVKPRGLAGGVAQFVEFADCIERGAKPETGACQAAIIMEVVSSVYGKKGMPDFD
jgi:predicted dehydrogenase